MSEKLTIIVLLDKFLEGGETFRGLSQKMQSFCHSEEVGNLKEVREYLLNNDF